MHNSSSQGTLLAKQKWGWELMFQGKRSVARSWWCCGFDKRSNWSWGSPLPLVPYCKLRKLLSNPEKKASARFFAMQPVFFVFILVPSFFSASKKKKKKKIEVRPAVKGCNPDAVTVLLFVNHQRHHFAIFFQEKKKKKFEHLMNSKK